MPPKVSLEDQLLRIYSTPEKLIRVGDPIIDPFRDAIIQKNSGAYAALAKILYKRQDAKGGPLAVSDFDAGLQEFGVTMRREDVDRLARLLDRKNKGSLSVEEFMRGIRPELTVARQDLVLQAFHILNASGTGEVPLSEFLSLYDVTMHPLVLCKKKTADAVAAEFADDWRRIPGGIVRLTDFLEYYSNLSASTDSDDLFELIIRNGWHISGGEGIARNMSCAKVEVCFEDGRRGIFEIKNDLRSRKPGINADDAKRILSHQGLKGIASVVI
jgi:calcyphosin